MWQVAVLGAATCAAILSGCSSSAPQWENTWSASFAGPPGGGVPANDWKYVTGRGASATGSTGEREQLTSSTANVHLNGSGDIQLVPLRDSAGNWTSGRIESRRSFAAPAGGQMQVSASIQQPGGPGLSGYWPAFWLLGNGTWPGSGEIDIMEDVNGIGFSGAMHCGNLSSRNADGTTGPCHETGGIGTGLLPGPVALQTGHHTYSVIIDRRQAGNEQARWYLDGRQFFSVSENQVGAAVWAQATGNSFRIILDLAIGGVYPDSKCHCQSPLPQTVPGVPMSVARVTVEKMEAG